MFAQLAVASTLVASTFAHGGVGWYTINGVSYKGWRPYDSSTGQVSIQRQWPSYDPIFTTTGKNILCNGATLDTIAPVAQLSASIAPGDKITATWLQWTHQEGPVMVYMAKCPGACKDWDGTGKSWFKIDELGLISGSVYTGTWANGIVFGTLNWTSTIPPNLAPGEYLIRHELLAIHQANTPQFYPECAQLTVTGSGTASPPDSYLVSFPGAYSDSDPSIHINIYDEAQKSVTTYAVPGPPVWPPKAGSSSTAAATSTTKVSSSTTTTRASTTTSGGTGAPLYGQCGGTGWTGPTTCAQGTCKVLNAYYSQCVP